jgi:putative endonuclease
LEGRVERTYYVYILASRKYGALYVGVTSDLVVRVSTHRDELIRGHTSRYHIHRLVHYEEYDSIEDAIVREKRLKKWLRSWKIELIEKENPQWDDLYERALGVS